LQIVFETAVGFHAGIQRILPGMTEGGMTEIMRQRDGLGQVFVETQMTRH